jgi:indole-3-glycerol phosphate synthase
MTTDLSHTFRVLDMIENTRVVVSESGIRSREDVVRLRRHGVNIVLVGEHLLRQADPGVALRELLAGPTSEADQSDSGRDDSGA